MPDPLGPESGLKQLTLPLPELPFAGGQSVTEDNLQAIVERCTAVIAVLLLKDLTDMGGVRQDKDRTPPGNGEAHHISERLGSHEHGERIAGECRQHAENRHGPAQDRWL